MSEEMSEDLKAALSQISSLTADLLSDGKDPAQVAWALTTVATDMSLQVCSEPLRIVPVLLNAITLATERFIASDEEKNSSDEEITQLKGAPAGLLLH
ncbi:hypothetical protein N9D70_00905 [bacterium]|nr:hypothetical protein [bacterium]